MRVGLPVVLVLCQVLVVPQLGSASVNPTGIASPPTFPTITLPADADAWVSNHDLTTCDLMMQRVTHVGSEVYSLAFQQPAAPQCSDTSSLTWAGVHDRLALWLNASGTDATSSLVPGVNASATDATSNLAFGLRYALSESLSWTVQGLVSGSEGGTQTMLQYSPSADWYMRALMSASSSGDATSSTLQQVEVGYQGHAGPQVSVTLARQLFGIGEFDTTAFTFGTPLHDVYAQFNYRVATANVIMEEFSVARTLHYPTLSLAFPINGWWWTVSGMMGDASNVMVSFSREDGNLSADLSLIPLGFWLSFSGGF